MKKLVGNCLVATSLHVPAAMSKNVQYNSISIYADPRILI